MSQQNGSAKVNQAVPVDTKPVEPLMFELGRSGRRGTALPPCDVPQRELTAWIPAAQIRKTPAPLPELSELEVVRHFTKLSQRNVGIDTTMYPLGSCTMKYNPKVNEEAAGIPGFKSLHPYSTDELAQGALEVLWRLERILMEVSGMDRVTLQPAAGAHGEMTALLMIRAYHDRKGRKPTEILVPDTAHGTNPASAAIAGYTVHTIPSNAKGMIDVEALRKQVGPQTAALMLTNPNTLGLFEQDITTITSIVHEHGGLVYYDGANMNAIMGRTRPGDMGVDLMHFNLHKTFSTPHGGGGPGAGPVGVKKHLVEFLPYPMVEQKGEGFALDFDRPHSIGKVRTFLGNFGILLRAYTYIRSLGPDGLKVVSENAVLNANYIYKRVGELFDVPYPGLCAHEFVVSAKTLKAQTGIRALDIAKRLLDYGFYAPTIYFPLIVDEAIMVEPTETEYKEMVDKFADALGEIVKEARTNPDLVHNAPHTTPVSRLDEVLAARQLNLRYKS